MKGFSLIEILVSLAILGIIMAALLGVLNLGNVTYNEDMGLLDLQQQTRQVMDGMIREIRQNKLSDITITDPGPDSGAAIKFKIPDNAYCFRYALSSNQVTREILSSCSSSSWLAQQVLANNINSLNFSLSGNIIEVRLQAKKNVWGRDLWFPASAGYFIEQVKLRN